MINNTVFFSLYNLAHQSIFLDGLFIFLAKYLPYLAVLFLIIYILYHDIGQFDWRKPFSIIQKRFKEFFMIFSPAIISWIIVHILKSISSEPRPFIKFADMVHPLFTSGGMDSFPSGHATFFGALAISVFFVNKKIGWIYFLIAILIGITRIIAGVHFPIDILTGYILGAVTVLIFHIYCKKYKNVTVSS